MSDTPRTDAAFFNPMSIMYDPVSEMKILERELNAANDRIKRLEEAGNEMMSEPCEYTCQKWIKGKEAKP